MIGAVVPAMAVAALCVWSLVLWRCRGYMTGSGSLPRSVKEGLFVAVLSACGGGLVASLGFVDAIPVDLSAAAASAWRAAVLVAGIYAIIGMRRARGR